MVTQPLLDYIRQQLGSGVAREDLRKALTTQGWVEQDLDEAFAASGGEQRSTVPTEVPTITVTQSTATSGSKRKWSLIVGVIAVLVLVGSGMFFAVPSIQSFVLTTLHLGQTAEMLPTASSTVATLETQQESQNLSHKIFISPLKTVPPTAGLVAINMAKEANYLEYLEDTSTIGIGGSYEITVPAGWYVPYSPYGFLVGPSFSNCPGSSYCNGIVYFTVSAFTPSSSLNSSYPDAEKYLTTTLSAATSTNVSVLNNLIPNARVVKQVRKLGTGSAYIYYIYFNPDSWQTNGFFMAVGGNTDKIEPILTTMTLIKGDNSVKRDLKRFQSLDNIGDMLLGYYEKFGQYPKSLNDLKFVSLPYIEYGTTTLQDIITDPLGKRDYAYSYEVDKMSGKVVAYHLGLSLENVDNPLLPYAGCSPSKQVGVTYLQCPAPTDFDPSTAFPGSIQSGCSGESGRACFNLVCVMTPGDKNKVTKNEHCSFESDSGKIWVDRSAVYTDIITGLIKDELAKKKQQIQQSTFPSQTQVKGSDAAIQDDLTAIQTQTEIYYGNNKSSYGTQTLSTSADICKNGTGIFSDPTIRKLIDAALTAAGATSNVACVASKNGYTLTVPLKSGGNWCVDSKGDSKQVTGTVTTHWSTGCSGVLN